MSRVVELLGPQGPLSRSLQGYEHRQGQLEMASAVEHALACSETLVCEAGTGTGKTLAYLVPAALSGRKVVVSTATKALQDQIASHDLALIEAHLGLHIEFAIAKGLNNYLCVRRFEEFRRSAEAGRSLYSRSLGMVEKWAAVTETGDVAELKNLPENDPIWAEICASSDTRKGAKCEKYRDCFVARMRKRAEQAQLVVANHHLVFADLAVREGSDDQGGALPPYDAIVFDEAHQMEDIASDFFGVQVSSRRVEALAHDAERALATAGLADPLMGRGESLGLSDRLLHASRDQFAQLAMAVDRREPGRRQLDRSAWTGVLQQSYFRLDAVLDALQSFTARQERDDAVRAISQRAAQVRADLQAIVDGNRARAITWVEVRPRSAALGLTPIDVAERLRSQLLEKVPSVVLTSATLATSGSFEFFRTRVGADSPHVTVRELQVPSPFDFASRALLYTPTDLPEPTSPSFHKEAAKRAAELIALSGGGAFVLCTSVRGMEVMSEELSTLLKRKVLVQGDGPKQTLLERFRTHGHEVLVATMSFWEGVDVAGDALRMVIIDKIPFAVPTDPVVAARCAAIEEAGGNAFGKYQVPSAAITLKQGFGRLIRTQTDRGVVAVLDRRLALRGYGKMLRASLPPATRVESLAQVRQFWANAFDGT